MKPIICRITVEVLGAPKDHVDKTINAVVDKLKEEENVQIRDIQIHETIPYEKQDQFFTAFAEVEFQTNDLKKVLEICYDYMPSNIEIVEPAGLEMDCNDIADVFNDFLAKLHRYNAVVQNLTAENKVMLRELEQIHGGRKVQLNKTTVLKEKKEEE